MAKDKPVELLVKWASFSRTASNIGLPKNGYSLIAIPRVTPPDEWTLVCNTQALAAKLAAELKGAHSTLLEFGINKPTIVVSVGDKDSNGDFSEAALIAKLMGAGFPTIKETERPWGKPLRK